ncbi:hypothetical protein BDR06DRAFT_952260 [Suillus hirtellus]|nr:hypothetical protein BDR06DRAFT_952260 [Suillus hirtellus]
MDLEAEARHHGFTPEELFGTRSVLLGLLPIINITLLVLLAAMGTMNIQSAHVSQA